MSQHLFMFLVFFNIPLFVSRFSTSSCVYIMIHANLTHHYIWRKPPRNKPKQNKCKLFGITVSLFPRMVIYCLRSNTPPRWFLIKLFAFFFCLFNMSVFSLSHSLTSPQDTLVQLWKVCSGETSQKDTHTQTNKKTLSSWQMMSLISGICTFSDSSWWFVYEKCDMIILLYSLLKGVVSGQHKETASYLNSFIVSIKSRYVDR